MNKLDAMTYAYPALKKFNPDVLGFNSENVKPFEKYLGIHDFTEYLSRQEKHDFPMREDLKRLLIAYVGPHGDTIMRAYRIQKGLEK